MNTWLRNGTNELGRSRRRSEVEIKHYFIAILLDIFHIERLEEYATPDLCKPIWENPSSTAPNSPHPCLESWVGSCIGGEEDVCVEKSSWHPHCVRDQNRSSQDRTTERISKVWSKTSVPLRIDGLRWPLRSCLWVAIC